MSDLCYIVVQHGVRGIQLIGGSSTFLPEDNLALICRELNQLQRENVKLRAALGSALGAPVCPECHQPRPGDERVKAGMKCGPCAYGSLIPDKEITE